MDELVVNVMNTPVEAVETEFPVRVESYELAQDSGGPGTFRGGLGVRRQWRILADEVVVNLRTDRFKFASPGIFDAKSALPSAASLVSADKVSKPLTSKAAGLRLKKDDVLTLQFAGGGGWGDPHERPAERVQHDVACGYVSRQAAREAYGVAFNDDLSIDPEATARLRGAKAAS
jgi:N-methylhydantoinase B